MFHLMSSYQLHLLWLALLIAYTAQGWYTVVADANKLSLSTSIHQAPNDNDHGMCA